ncbi:MAG: hypothetical protein DRZ82_01785 [Thermoprotei archaeon]|nr:MAG: hypothetical protein DRZ82_01785 [Thermoprotei archaeon]
MIDVLEYSRLSLVMLVMSIPRIMAHILFFAIGVMALRYWGIFALPIFICHVAPIAGLIYGCLVTILSGVDRHPRAFAYAHGIFSSIASLPLLMTFNFTKDPNYFKRYFPEFSLPLWVAILIYSVLYAVYAVLAYRSLSMTILDYCKKPSKDVLYYWRASAITGIVLATVLIYAITKCIVEGSGMANWYVLAYAIVYVIMVLILCLDEIFLNGKLRHMRYPIFIPLLVHTSCLFIIFSPLIPERIIGSFFETLLVFPITAVFPGIAIGFGFEQFLALISLSFIFPYTKVWGISGGLSIPLLILSFWVLFEFLAFYKIFKRAV